MRVIRPLTAAVMQYGIREILSMETAFCHVVSQLQKDTY